MQHKGIMSLWKKLLLQIITLNKDNCTSSWKNLLKVKNKDEILKMSCYIKYWYNMKYRMVVFFCWVQLWKQGFYSQWEACWITFAFKCAMPLAAASEPSVTTLALLALLTFKLVFVFPVFSWDSKVAWWNPGVAVSRHRQREGN